MATHSSLIWLSPFYKMVQWASSFEFWRFLKWAFLWVSGHRALEFSIWSGFNPKYAKSMMDKYAIYVPKKLVITPIFDIHFKHIWHFLQIAESVGILLEVASLHFPLWSISVGKIRGLEGTKNKNGSEENPELDRKERSVLRKPVLKLREG